MIENSVKKEKVQSLFFEVDDFFDSGDLFGGDYEMTDADFEYSTLPVEEELLYTKGLNSTIPDIDCFSDEDKSSVDLNNSIEEKIKNIESLLRSEISLYKKQVAPILHRREEAMMNFEEKESSDVEKFNSSLDSEISQKIFERIEELETERFEKNQVRMNILRSLLLSDYYGEEFENVIYDKISGIEQVQNLTFDNPFQEDKEAEEKILKAFLGDSYEDKKSHKNSKEKNQEDCDYNPVKKHLSKILQSDDEVLSDSKNKALGSEW